MPAHITADYVIFVLLAVRVVWGFSGTVHARFDDFAYRPRFVLLYFRDVLLLCAARFRGHNPAGSAMIMALLFFLLLTTVCGVLLYFGGAWLGVMARLMKCAESAAVEFLDSVHTFSANICMMLFFRWHWRHRGKRPAPGKSA